MDIEAWLDAIQQIDSTFQGEDGACTKWIQAFGFIEDRQHTHSHRRHEKANASSPHQVRSAFHRRVRAVTYVPLSCQQSVMDTGARIQYNLTRENYAQPRETAGRTSTIIHSGDYLSLPPVPKSVSLLANIEGTSDEHKAAAGMFASIEQVFELETMMRFRDPVLKLSLIHI